MKHITKNLANCKPSEFLRQTNKIRKSVEKWLTITDIANIRKQLPKVPETASAEERKKATEKQIQSNLSQMLDVILDEHPAETLELLGLLCFVEPAEVDEYPMAEYISAFTDLITSEVVINFFTSFQRLGLMNTSN